MKKTALAFTAIAISALYACAIAQPQQAATSAAPIAKTEVKRHPKSDDILVRTMVYNFQIRSGQYSVAPELVKMLQQATAEAPEDAALWAALGNAHYMAALNALQPGQNPADAMTAFQAAAASHSHALEIDPDQPVARAGHGQGMVISAGMQRKPELMAPGVADMNRAVEIAPNRSDIRLVRAFSMLNLPAAARDQEALDDDFAYLIKAAGDSRQGAMMHVLRGDMYAEAGKADLAHGEYAVAAKSTTPAGEQGRTRIAALDAGGVAAADIAAIRNGLGSNCVMCHGS